MNVSRASQLQSELKRRRGKCEKEEKPWGRGTEFNEYKQGQTA
jgi:hypothetical protein